MTFCPVTFCPTFFCQTILRVTLSSSPTKLCVRPESMIVDTLGGICRFKEQNCCPHKSYMPRGLKGELSG
jgi:hypothetical protein